MAGHVYLIGSRLFGWYKIGKSSNAAIRVSELGILLPFRIEVIAIWKSENHHELEKFLHEKYADERINGEWFAFRKGRLNDVIYQINGLRLASHQVNNISSFSNIEKDASLPAPRSVEKRIDKITKRASEAERRVKELEALLQSMEMPKI